MSKTATSSQASRREGNRRAVKRGDVVSALQGFFAWDVMERGAKVFRNGAVELTAESERHATAEVTGTSTYRTGIQLQEGVVDLWCSCPYVESEGEPCKHLWAVVQAVDAAGFLTRLTPSRVRRARLATGWNELRARTAPARGALGSAMPQAFEQSGAGAAGAQAATGVQAASPAPRPAELLCVINRSGLRDAGALFLDLWIQSADGRLERATPARLWQVELGEMHPELHAALRQASRYAADDVPMSFGAASLGVWKQLCRERRLVYDTDSPARPLEFDGGAPWRLRLRATPHSGGLLLSGELVRGRGRRERVAPLEEAKFLLQSGLVAWSDRLARLTADTNWPWIRSLRQHSPQPIPAEEVEAFLDEVLAAKAGIDVILPEAHRLELAKTTPEPWLTVRADEVTRRLSATVELQYGQRRVPLPHRHERVADVAERKLHVHDVDRERAALTQLAELGFRGRILSSKAPSPVDVPVDREPLELAARRLPQVIGQLLAEGWRVEAHGKILRRSGSFNLHVTSGTDWFALEGHVEFEGERLGLPELLKAVRRGSTTVELGDGTVGVLPEAWLARLGMLAATADPSEPKRAARVPRAQVMLLDELVQQHSGIGVDPAYTRLRNELRTFTELKPAEPPRSFRGELRGYQREGLAWMQFLGRLGFGGCLADDMGLGKTVQVLALLLGRNRRRRHRPPSLVVAPSSVVFNWMDEARRFTPSLRVIAFAGPDRPPLGEAMQNADLLVTNYALLRKEVDALSSTEFDYVVLDEAQAIKNHETSTTQAARRLTCNHRLAITGTPIENHLGELASQFEFLNPGILGASAPLRAAFSGGRADRETLEVVQRAVRPFLLRRTKRDVAPELPERIENTLYVELAGEERRRYDELHLHFRERIKDRVAKLGLARSTPQVLEALLRLRQAACHPGLLDAQRRHEPSAKLERLLLELLRIEAAGEKCLVFSQFTSLLSIVKERLDARGIQYEYLDGKSRDRKQSVARFQASTDVRVFLISLKAGGVGLNLTAAEHVFLLDPWWNPAVEAQAIDRTHRIGQTRTVLAYKLIARRTVEEKVLELQREKRALVQSIFDEDGTLGAKLTRDDLEALLT